MKPASQFAFASIGVLLAAMPAHAEPADSGITSSWTWPPYIVIPLLIIGGLYSTGVIEICRRSARPSWPQILCFAGGWTSLLLALDSPIHEISEQLFCVHMTQHEILMLISAPLLVWSRPLVPMLWALPERMRSSVATLGRSRPLRRIWIALSAPIVVWLLHAAALWLWHLPSLFVATLRSQPVHAAQHISFLGTALLFWWALLNRHPGHLSYGGAVVYVFTTAIHTSVLGALLTFGQHAWYAPYAATAPLWHLTALEDQQLGGLIMWVPAGSLLAAIGLFLLQQWINESQRRWEYTRTAALIRGYLGGSS